MPRSKKEPLFNSLIIEPTLAVVRAGSLATGTVHQGMVDALNREATSAPDHCTWKLGPASHLMVLCCEQPFGDMNTAHAAMQAKVAQAAEVLSRSDLMLLPGGMHPCMGNGTNMCTPFPGSGHSGWVNNQCLVVRLPFSDDEFAKAFAAVRVLLPILPAISAASPFDSGRAGDSLDMRLINHTKRLAEWPALAGPVIPEAVFTQDEYYRMVYTPMVKVLADAGMHETADLLAMDSRLAAVNFAPDQIELKILDGQESSSANLALAELIVAVLRKLCNGRWASSYVQRAWDPLDLGEILRNVLGKGPDAVIDNQQYLSMFGSDATEMSVALLWEHIITQLGKQLSVRCRDHVRFVLREGNLAKRLLKSMGPAPEMEQLKAGYASLCSTFARDRVFGD